MNIKTIGGLTALVLVNGTLAGCLGSEENDTASGDVSASFSFSLETATVQDTVTVTDQSDENAPIVSWQWDFGDGTTSTDRRPNHRYDYVGTYQVNLTVRTSNGTSYTASKQITIVPKSVADFRFTNLEGTTSRLSDYDGKAVILDMWATWCSPCQYQMLELKKAYENYSRNDVEILSINIDARESAEQIQAFIDTFYNYGYALDWVFGMDVDGTVWEHFKIGGGIPTLCIFDRDGNLVFAHEGVAIYSTIPEGWPANTLTLETVLDNILTEST
jgi:PKD repeat protein